MDASRVRALVGHQPTELPLRYGPRAYNLFLLAASAIFSAMVLVAIAILMRAEQLDRFVIVGLVAGLILTIVRIHLRQGRVVVVLDQEGIREMEGGLVRVAIPWEEARGWCRERKLRYRTGAIADLVDLKFASGDGKLIAFTNYEGGSVLFPGDYFRSITRHLPLAVMAIARALPDAGETATDDRMTVARGGYPLRMVAFLGFVIVTGSLVVIEHHFAQVSYASVFRLAPCAALTGLLFLGSSLALVRPFVRMRRLRQPPQPTTSESGGFAYRAAPPGSSTPFDAFRQHQFVRARIELYVRVALLILFTAYPLALRTKLQRACVEERHPNESCDDR